jgi:hypothetical protein
VRDGGGVASYVYWTYNAGVNKAPAGGGASTTVASGQVNSYQLAIDGTTLYFVSSGGGSFLRKVSTSGGTVTTLYTAAAGESIGGVAAASGYVYFATSTYANPGGTAQIRRISSTGSGLTTLWTDNSGAWFSDVTYTPYGVVFIRNPYEFTSAVFRIPVAGGTATEASARSPVTLVASGDAVFYAADGALWQYLTTTSVETQWAADATSYAAYAADSQVFYTTATQGEIKQASFQAPETLVTGADPVAGITVDSLRIYFIDCNASTAQGRVMRVAR